MLSENQSVTVSVVVQHNCKAKSKSVSCLCRHFLLYVVVGWQPFTSQMWSVGRTLCTSDWNSIKSLIGVDVTVKNWFELIDCVAFVECLLTGLFISWHTMMMIMTTSVLSVKSVLCDCCLQCILTACYFVISNCCFNVSSLHDQHIWWLCKHACYAANCHQL